MKGQINSEFSSITQKD